VEESSPDAAVAPAIYEVGGRRFNTASPGFAEAIADAHATNQRPKCMCQVDDTTHGVEMYVARLAGSSGGFIVKRMPNTGSQHAPDCPSYEPPAGLSGLGQVLGSAIVEDPVSGETALKLGFAMSRMSGRSTMPSAGEAGDSVATGGTRLSLRALLHYLWDQAELTRWQPRFAGKRSWAIVRARLLQAALHKTTHDGSLAERLYIPEPFALDRRDEINARRLAQWARAMTPLGKAQHLMLLVAEVKEIVPARYGFKAIVKHVPDQAFALDALLYRRLGRRFERELSLWGSSEDLHMVMIATFALGGAGIPAIAELSLMPVTAQWLPVEDAFEQCLVGHLVHDSRSFVKGLRYNLPPGEEMVCATLVEGKAAPVSLLITRNEFDPQRPGLDEVELEVGTTPWVWRVAQGAMPALPTIGEAEHHSVAYV